MVFRQMPHLGNKFIGKSEYADKDIDMESESNNKRDKENQESAELE